MKRKRKRLQDLPQSPPKAHLVEEALEEAGIPEGMRAEVAYSSVTYLAIGLVQAAGGRVVLPHDWIDQAGANNGLPKEHPDTLVLQTRWEPDGYVVSVVTLGEAYPDPRRN